MITVAEAEALIKKNLPDWGMADAELKSFGRHEAAEDVFSDREYPPINRATMDGIAVNFAAFQSGRRQFSIQGAIAAGQPLQKLQNPEGCFEIMTGAPVPEGADLVVPYEHIRINENAALIEKEGQRTRFENIHLQGSDCASGAKVLTAGHAMHGPHWGIVASMGYEKIKVKRKPRVMIISTGDELVDTAALPLAHQLRRSNAYAMQASLLAAGFADVALDHLSDDAFKVAEHYRKNSPLFDMLIYSGGVSKGKFDYLPSVWADLGVKKIFHEVSQRPGKPLWFGVDEKSRTAVFGLPGNPISSLVCLHRYAIPSKKMYVKLGEEFVFKKELTYFLPVKLSYGEDATVSASPLKYQNSGEFTALAGSDGFIELPKDKDIFAGGEVFPFYAWQV